MSLTKNIRKAFDSWNRCREENDKLRAYIADSTYPCLYCGLSKEDTAKCVHGFPGCGRADDLMTGYFIGCIDPDNPGKPTRL